jgi:hypothetical protein
VPLTYRDRRQSGTQVDVLSGELVVATVYEVKQSSRDNAANWKWTFYHRRARWLSTSWRSRDPRNRHLVRGAHLARVA